MGVPVIYGSSFYLWTVDVHKWSAKNTNSSSVRSIGKDADIGKFGLGYHTSQYEHRPFLLSTILR